MLNTTDAADVLNLVETRAVNSLEADSWLKTGGTGGIGLIHRKTLRQGRTYQAHELPALAVEAARIAPTEDDAPDGAHEIGVSLAVEAFHAGADHDALVWRIKTIAAHLRQWLADQELSGGNRLDGLLDEGDGRIVPGKVNVTIEQAARWTYRAAARLEATVRLWVSDG